MSHFTVLVILPKAWVVDPALNTWEQIDASVTEEKAQEIVSALIARYDEQIDVEPYETECYCVNQTAQKAASARADAEFGTLADLRKSFVSPLPEGAKIASGDVKDAFDTFKAEADVINAAWRVHLNPRLEAEQRYLHEHPDYGKGEPTCEECHGSGKRTTTYNPDTFEWKDGNGNTVATTWATEAVSGVWNPQGSGQGFLPHGQQKSSIPFLVLQGVSPSEESTASPATAEERHLSEQIQNLIRRLPGDANGAEGGVRDLRVAADEQFTWRFSGGSLPQNRQGAGLALFRLQLVNRSGEGVERVITSDGRLLRSALVGGSKWDWWQIGGRWRGSMTNDGRDIFQMSELQNGWKVFAIVTPDGEWHAEGDMGWWGVTANEDDKWDRKMYELASAFPEHMGVLIDCHI